jgi:hypothetical protein
MTEITYYVASTKGYLQQCDSLQHAMNVLKKCEREQPGLGSFFILRTPHTPQQKGQT